MERQRDLQITLTEEEAYELLLRCVSNDEEDNPAFKSALSTLAEAIKSTKRAHLRVA